MMLRIESGQINEAKRRLGHKQAIERIRVKEAHPIESADISILNRQFRARENFHGLLELFQRKVDFSCLIWIPQAVA